MYLQQFDIKLHSHYNSSGQKCGSDRKDLAMLLANTREITKNRTLYQRRETTKQNIADKRQTMNREKVGLEKPPLTALYTKSFGKLQMLKFLTKSFPLLRQPLVLVM